MNIAALKEQARALERRGDTAAALDVYESILAHLETSSVEPEAPLFVKMGDLSLKTGRAEAAIAMFERAARRYAQLGSHRSVIALCVKILRTDSSQTPMYFKCARVMLEHDQVKPARLVLLDYAERARMRKTLSKLRELEATPDEKLKAMLVRLLDVADRSLQSGPAAESSAKPSEAAGVTPSMTSSVTASVTSSATPSAVATTEGTVPPPAPTVSGLPSATTSTEELATPTEPVPTKPALPERPLRDTSVFEAISLPELAERPDAPPEVPVHESKAVQQFESPASSVVPAGAAEGGEPDAVRSASAGRPAPDTVATAAPAVQEEPSVPRRRSRGAGRRGRSARPAWAIPALAAAAVAVFGVSLIALGAFSSGGELGAEPPRSASTSQDGEHSESSMSAVPTPEILTINGFNAIQGREEQDQVGEDEPAPLDRQALASATEAVKTVDIGSVDAPSTDFVAEAGRITSDPAALTYRERSLPASATPSPTGPDIVIDGLEIEGVARSSASYQVVHRMPSGARITLTVEPFENAPEGETGVLRVEPIGADSAQGSVRFGDYLVSAHGHVTPAVLGNLLDRLVERGE